MKIFFLFLIISVSTFSQNISPLTQKIKSLDGSSVTLQELKKDKPLFISFWALWCAPCKSELKALQKLYDSIYSKGGVIVAINIDSPKSFAKVRAYVETQNITMPILFDQNSNLFEILNGQELPYSVLFDKKGNIVQKKKSYVPGDENIILSEILKLISEN